MLKEKAKQIKLLILDVDGVLTDGKIWIGPTGEEYKVFHIHDGHGLKQLQRNGITVAIISGRSCPALKTRLAELQIENCFLGQSNKIDAFHTLLNQFDLDPQQVAYIGDDEPDLAVMEKVGFPIAVSNAVDSIKSIAIWETRKSGGNGAVREACDFLLSAQAVGYQQ